VEKDGCGVPDISSQCSENNIDRKAQWKDKELHYKSDMGFYNFPFWAFKQDCSDLNYIILKKVSHD
jgi:hypothetical protein